MERSNRNQNLEKGRKEFPTIDDVFLHVKSKNKPLNVTWGGVLLKLTDQFGKNDVKRALKELGVPDRKANHWNPWLVTTLPWDFVFLREAFRYGFIKGNPRCKGFWEEKQFEKNA